LLALVFLSLLSCTIVSWFHILTFCCASLCTKRWLKTTSRTGRVCRDSCCDWQPRCRLQWKRNASDRFGEKNSFMRCFCLCCSAVSSLSLCGLTSLNCAQLHHFASSPLFLSTRISTLCHQLAEVCHSWRRSWQNSWPQHIFPTRARCWQRRSVTEHCPHRTSP
jgi:hypothetical protein